MNWQKTREGDTNTFLNFTFEKEIFTILKPSA
jgi:hypothetical protein